MELIGEHIYTKNIKSDKLEIKFYKVLGFKKGTKSVLEVENINLHLSDFIKRYITRNPNGIDPMKDYNNEIYTFMRYSCQVTVSHEINKSTIRLGKTSGYLIGGEKYFIGKLCDGVQNFDCNITHFVND
jgi:hypothetical protein